MSITHKANASAIFVGDKVSSSISLVYHWSKWKSLETSKDKSVQHCQGYHILYRLNQNWRIINWRNCFFFYNSFYKKSYWKFNILFVIQLHIHICRAKTGKILNYFIHLRSLKSKRHTASVIWIYIYSL